MRIRKGNKTWRRIDTKKIAHNKVDNWVLESDHRMWKYMRIAEYGLFTEGI